MIFFIFIFFPLLIIDSKETSERNKPIFKCETDKTEPIPKFAINISPINKYKRTLDNLDQDGFKAFNIFLDLNNFDYEVELYNLTDKKELFVSGLTKALETLTSLLKVKPI